MAENEGERIEGTGGVERDSDAIIADYLYRLASESVRMEDDRTKSLNEYAGHLMTGLTITSVAVLTVAEPLFGFFTVTWQRVVLASCYAVVSLCYLAAFILAIIALNRRKYKALESPKIVSDALKGEFESREEAARLFCESMNDYFTSRVDYNEKTLGILSAAKVLIIVGTGIIAAAVVLFFIIALVIFT